MTRKRIVITGIGGLCSLGVSAPEIWASMRAGRSGIGEITNAPLYELKVRIGAEIKSLPENVLDRKRTVTMDRFSLLAALAAGEAIGNARLDVAEADGSRIGADRR